MPNRILRDGILRSEKVALLSPMAELFYRRLMSVVDDFGRYYANSALLLSDCFPIRPTWADEDGVSRWVGECEHLNLIGIYEVSGTDFLELKNFDQRIRPGQRSKFPESAGSFRDSREKSAYARASTPPTTPPTTTTTEAPAPKFAAVVASDLFENLVGAFLAAGVLLNEQDRMEACREWVSLPDSAHEPAAALAARKAQENEARFMGLPANFLRKREWDRAGPGRILPEPHKKTAKESAQDEAERRFAETRRRREANNGAA